MERLLVDITECGIGTHFDIAKRLFEMTKEGADYEGAEYSVEDYEDEELDNYGIDISVVYVDDCYVSNKTGKDFVGAVVDYLESNECLAALISEDELAERLVCEGIKAIEDYD